MIAERVVFYIHKKTPLAHSGAHGAFYATKAALFPYKSEEVSS